MPSKIFTGEKNKKHKKKKKQNRISCTEKNEKNCHLLIDSTPINQNRSPSLKVLSAIFLLRTDIKDSFEISNQKSNQHPTYLIYQLEK